MWIFSKARVYSFKQTKIPCGFLPSKNLRLTSCPPCDFSVGPLVGDPWVLDIEDCSRDSWGILSPMNTHFF